MIQCSNGTFKFSYLEINHHRQKQNDFCLLFVKSVSAVNSLHFFYIIFIIITTSGVSQICFKYSLFSYRVFFSKAGIFIIFIFILFTLSGIYNPISLQPILSSVQCLDFDVLFLSKAVSSVYSSWSKYTFFFFGNSELIMK